MKKFLLLLFLVVMLLPFNTYAVTAEVEKQEKAIVAVGNAYLNQGSQVQYDSYRKQLYATPEDATSQHIVYTVCSGFTFQTYYQALGIEIPDTTDELLWFAKDNEGSSYVLEYYTRDELAMLGANNDEIGDAVYAKWLPIIRPGDIIVHTGHAILVRDVDVAGDKVILLEAALSARYNASTHKDNVDSSNTLVANDLKNRIKAIINNEEVALIRPVKDGNTYLKQSGTYKERIYEELSYSGITEAAKTRMAYAGIDIEKTIDIKDGTSQNILVGLGEVIEYKIVIKNNGTVNYNGLSIVEEIPSILELVSAGSGTVSGKKITWNINSLNVGDSITITYSVKVPNDRSLLGKMFVSTGNVNNIKTSRIETLIGTKYSSDDRNKLKLAYDEIKGNDSTERTFINDIYKKALNLDLGLSNSLSNLDIMAYDASVNFSGNNVLAVRRTKLKDSSVKKYVYHNFYGPRLFDGSNRDCPDNNLVNIMVQWNIYAENELNDRARNIFSSMLLDGDIILTYTNDIPTPTDKNICPNEILENRSYIYLNNKLIRKKTKTDIEEITGTELTTFLNDLVGHNYVILRPSNEKFEITDDGKVTEEVEVEDTFATIDFPYIGLLFVVVGLGIWMYTSKKINTIVDDSI